MTAHISTNGQERFLMDAYQVPAEILADQFDYLEEGEGSFFQYRGCWYEMGDFMTTQGSTQALGDWDGYRSDSYFSGVLIKLSNDGESIKVGTFYS